MSDNFQKYKDEIDRVYGETKEEMWTMPFATLVLLLAAILFLTVIVNLVFISFGWFSVLIYAVEAGVLSIVLYRHQQKVYAATRHKIATMEGAHPGISEAFNARRGKSGAARR
jgi:hypothetical protein